MKKTILIILFLFTLQQTLAQTQSPTRKNEIKLGLLKHDMAWFGGGKDEPGPDINLEYIRKTQSKFAPYVHVGGSWNTKGGTDMLYSGWGYRLIKSKYFGQLDIGLTYHTYRKDKCSVVLREALQIGYKIGERYSLEAFLDHMSDAWMCEPNASNENGGVRVGFAF